jgi:hypothetical protein
MSAASASTTSPTPSIWTATGCECPKRSAPTSRLSACGEDTEPSTILRKGAKTVTIPVAPRTALAVDLAVGQRSAGPIFTTGDGRRLDRHGVARIVRPVARIVRRVARRAGIVKPIGPHTLRQAFITAALASHCAMCKKPPRTRIRAQLCAMTGPGSSHDRHATYIVFTYIAGAARSPGVLGASRPRWCPEPDASSPQIPEVPACNLASMDSRLVPRSPLG